MPSSSNTVPPDSYRLLLSKSSSYVVDVEVGLDVEEKIFFLRLCRRELLSLRLDALVVRE
jgi:hypothetical protein